MLAMKGTCCKKNCIDKEICNRWLIIVFFFPVVKNSFKQGDTSLTSGRSWQEILENLLRWRKEEDPDKVDATVWATFLLYAFVLLPCIQSW